MKRFGQVAASLAAMSLTSLALAGSYSEGCDCEITIPKYAGGVRVGVEALYLNADVKDTVYAASYQSQSGVDTFRSHDVDSDHDWGYAVELAYEVAGTGNDFVVNWTDVEFSGSDSVAIGGNNSGSINSSLIDFFYNSFADEGNVGSNNQNFDASYNLDHAKGSYDLDYTKIDFEAGQAIKVGHDSVVLRFHAGVRYANVDTTFKAHFLTTTVNESAAFSAESDFDGLGPRMGIDGTWHLGNGFSVVAEMAAALLVGDASVTQKYSEDTDGLAGLEFETAHRVSHDSVVVPNLEARLGVGYDYMFSNSSTLNLQAGFHVSNYFDVDYKLDNSGTDVGLSGLYLAAAYTL